MRFISNNGGIMVKRKAQTAEETAPAPAQENATPAGELAAASPPEATTGGASSATPAAQNHASVDAPPKGEGRAYTIDNHLGYRKEDSPDGKRRQIRFADREGGQ